MISNTKIEDAYTDILNCVANIKMNPTQKFVKDLQDALNTMFTDSECMGVIWTPNPDKLFFGIYIMPEMDADDVIKVITKDDVRYRVKKYMLELDGKLFGEYLGLTNDQITALLVHDIAALVSTSAPAEEVVKSLDKYLIDNHDVLKISDLVHYKEILSFGFRESMHKCTSIFELGKYKPHEDTMSDFLNMNGGTYSNDIVTALEKIDKMGYNFNREVNNKFIILSWVMRVYKDVLGYRIRAMKVLDRMQELTPSQIEKKELNNFSRRLVRIDDDMLLESITGVPMDSVDPLIEEVRRNNIPNADTNAIDCLDFVKNDLVGIALKQEQLEVNEPDAIPDLLRSINNRMAIAKDAIENTATDDEELKQWNQMYAELDKRRNEIAKAEFYTVKKKMVNTYKAQDDQ